MTALECGNSSADVRVVAYGEITAQSMLPTVRDLSHPGACWDPGAD